MNKRLLKHLCPNFDYTKINNSAYTKRKYTQLLLNYYWYETHNIDKVVLKSFQMSKPKWFFNLESIGLTEVLEAKFGTLDKSKIISAVSSSKCAKCGAAIPVGRKYCSTKCSASSELTQEQKTKLSTAVKAWHESMLESKKKEIRQKISDSISKMNSAMSTEERQAQYTNKTIRYTSYANLKTRFEDLEFLVDEEQYILGGKLPVRCKKCQFKWEVTKTTSISRATCPRCVPKRKHKTQTTIFNYIYEQLDGIASPQENVRGVISGELDIYVPEMKFAIEYDGLISHSYGPSKIKHFNFRDIDPKYHTKKTQQCEQLGIDLWHIFENEYLDETKRKIWMSKINTKLGELSGKLGELNKLGKARKVYARKCTIKEPSCSETREFFTRTHLQGNCSSTVKLGLYHDGVLVSCMTFRKHPKYEWEIARFSSTLNTVVVGAASKLLRHFERQYNPRSLMSFANRRWSTGALYEKLGFDLVSTTAPNYFYFKENENVLYPREKFQKHKLAELDGFNPQKTERQNMFNLGYRVIFDAGNKKYLKTYG
jgi:predicted nucleic acid-binding Zn ribbon protein